MHCIVLNAPAGITQVNSQPGIMLQDVISKDIPPLATLSQSLACKCGQNEASLVDLLVVVPAQLVFLLWAPDSQGVLDVSVGIFAANHEANLARRICGNGSVGIFNHREDFFAIFLELGNKRQMEPLVFSLGSNNTTILQGSVEKLKVWLLEQRLCWTLWITAVRDDDIEFVFAVSQEFEAISNVHFHSRVLEADGHARQVFLADTRDSLVNVTEDGLLHCFMLDDLTQNTTVTTANDQD